MDMERSIEFLVENAARHEAQLQGIRNLIEGGMKMIVSFQSETNRRLDALIDASLHTEERLSRLADAQTRTEQKLQSLIDSLKNPPNGNPQ